MHVTEDISRGDYLVYTVNRNDGHVTMAFPAAFQIASK